MKKSRKGVHAEADVLIRAIQSGNIADVREALASTKDVDAPGRDGRTALMEATLLGNEELVRILIQEGAAIDPEDREGWTALHFAAQEGQVRIAEMLLAAGTAIDVRDHHGNTPLWRAVFDSRGRGEMIRFLLAAGANPHMKNDHGVSGHDLAKTIANYDVLQFFG